MNENQLFLEEDFPLKSEFGTMLRKRNARRKEFFKLKRLMYSEYGLTAPCWVDKYGEYCDEGDPDAVRIHRCWRRQESKNIKRYCNRKFRRTNRFRMLVAQQKGFYRKATEFWWELD